MISCVCLLSSKLFMSYILCVDLFLSIILEIISMYWLSICMIVMHFIGVIGSTNFEKTQIFRVCKNIVENVAVIIIRDYFFSSDCQPLKGNH